MCSSDLGGVAGCVASVGVLVDRWRCYMMGYEKSEHTGQSDLVAERVVDLGVIGDIDIH